MRWKDDESTGTLKWKDEQSEFSEPIKRGKSRWKDDVNNSSASERDKLAAEYSKKYPLFLNPYIPEEAEELAQRKGKLYKKPSKGDPGIKSFLNRIHNVQQSVRTFDDSPFDVSTGNKVADTIADFIGFGVGLIGPGAGAGGPATSAGGTAIKAADYALIPAAQKLAGLPNKGFWGRRAKQAIHGATAGAGYGTAEGIVHGEDLKDIAKTAGIEAATFAIAEPLFGTVGEGFKAGSRDMVKYGSQYLNKPQPGQLLSWRDTPKGFKVRKEEPVTSPNRRLVTSPARMDYAPWVREDLITDFNRRRILQDDTGAKLRSLGVSAAEAEWTSPELRQGLKKEMVPGRLGVYEPISNRDTLEQAHRLMEEDSEAVVRRIMSGQPATALDNTAGLLLVKRANDTGDYAKAVDLVEALAARATEQGQAIQALSMWGRLTPEGMLRYGQKVIDQANNQNRRMAGRGNRFRMSDETAKRIVALMREAEGLEGRAKEIKVAQALDEIASQVPVPILRKVSTIHTMAQLLNPKTAIRNVVGNAGFQVLENVSDVVGAGLDVATSAFTGQRSKVLPSLLTQGKGMVKGGRLGLEDALLGIDTSAQATKFDFPQGRTFRKGPLAGLEKAMNIELRATDRAFYQAARDESLRQQMAAAARSGKTVSRPSRAMQEIAHHDALYRTFQDNNALSAFFQGFKRLLNDPAYTMGFAKDRPMREFGLGDFIIKYPRTPANLLARGLEYSPAGLLKTLLEASRPLMGRDFNQKAFVESFSRAITGTVSGVGLGAALHRLGIITGGPDEDLRIYRKVTAPWARS